MVVVVVVVVVVVLVLVVVRARVGVRVHLPDRVGERLDESHRLLGAHFLVLAVIDDQRREAQLRPLPQFLVRVVPRSAGADHD